MIYHLVKYLGKFYDIPGEAMLLSLTFRMSMGIIFALVIGLIIGKRIIAALRRRQIGEEIRDLGLDGQACKRGTPTMGGIIILASILVPVLLFGDLTNLYVILMIVSAVWLGTIGFLDDFLKIRNKRSLGLRAYQKIIGQFGLAIVAAIFAYNHPYIGSKLIVPISGAEWDLGVWYIPFTVFVIIALVNSVNLTDGLDGLASGVTLIIAAAMGVTIYGLFALSESAGELLLAVNLDGLFVFAGALAGACLGFLRFNTYPARVFMGDTGSFALGAALCAVFIFSRMSLLIPIMGGMFVASSVSVILQVGSYKLRKKRIFKMAPLHHHFELKGNQETKIVAMYMIITTMLCLVSLLAVL